MFIKPLLGVLAVFATAACGPETGPPEVRVGTSGSLVAAGFPAGDVEAGRQAFRDLKCTTCHSVPSEPSFPAPVGANPGPPMDARIARRDPSYLTTSIASPSHMMSKAVSPDVRARLEGRLSPMGDFTQVMTVRQLIDVHAFLRSLE